MKFPEGCVYLCGRDSEITNLTTRLSILKDLGIPVRVDLPGVGENFQDQGNNAVVFNTSAEATGVAVSQTFASPADIFGGDLAEIANSTRNELPRWADQIVSASADAGALLNKNAVETVLRAQHDLIFGEGATTLAEYLIEALGDGTLISQFWTLFPFSRGSVHLSSAEVSKINEPKIDPRFNLVDFDLTAQIQTSKLAERLWKTGPLKSLTSGRISPSLDILPESATDTQWREFIKTTCEPTCPHTTINEPAVPRKTINKIKRDASRQNSS